MIEKEKSTFLGLYLDHDLATIFEIEYAAKAAESKKHLTKSAFVRNILRNYLNRTEGDCGNWIY